MRTAILVFNHFPIPPVLSAGGIHARSAQIAVLLEQGDA